MCRNIRTLFNFEPPATDDEIRASALQFVRKLSGFNIPSKANEDAFNDAVEEVSDAARRLRAADAGPAAALICVTRTHRTARESTGTGSG